MKPDDAGIRTYVLRQGRMSDAQKRALEGEGARFLVPFAGAPLELGTLFSGANPVILEIGFGMGQATWQIAQAMPGRDFLAVEVHRPGVGKLVSELLARGIGNVRVVNHDAVEVMQAGIGPASLAGIHVFYPDPWPKKRHHKRRLLRPALVDLMVSRLEPGGYLYFVTDIEEYGRSTLELLGATEGLRNRYEAFAERQPWRPETKFEARATATGRGRFELYFERR